MKFDGVNDIGYTINDSLELRAQWYRRKRPQQGYSIVSPDCPNFGVCDNPCFYSQWNTGDTDNGCQILTFFTNTESQRKRRIEK